MNIGGGGNNHRVDAANHRWSVGCDISADFGGYGFGTFEPRISDNNTGHDGVIRERLSVERANASCSDQADSHPHILSGYPFRRHRVRLLWNVPINRTLYSAPTRCQAALEDRRMFRIWFERDMPDHVAATIAGLATPIGPGTATPDDLLSSVGAADAIIASSLATYDGPGMDRAPHLRVISRTGIGVDKIDIGAATERGIAVCNTPDAPTISTAEHTITLMLSVAKRVEGSQTALKSGGRDFFGSHDGREVSGKALGLVGVGRIGTNVARMAGGLSMTVIAYDPFVDATDVAQAGIQMVDSLDQLLADADVVSLHLPLTSETEQLMNAGHIAQMKPGAILINTARGGLVDHDALLAALGSGRLFGAGLDVTDPEPLPPDHPLLHRDDVVVTPHVAAATAEGKARLYESAVTQALQVLRGEYPNHLVNPDVWTVRRQDSLTEEK